MSAPLSAPTRARCYIVLTAAGAGNRLGAGIPKALVPAGGRALLEWALENLSPLARPLPSSQTEPAPCLVSSPDSFSAPSPDSLADEVLPPLAAVALTISPGHRAHFEKALAQTTSNPSPHTVSQNPFYLPGHPEIPLLLIEGSPHSRQDSVRLGIEALAALPAPLRPQDLDLLLIHDAARAFTPAAVFHRVIRALTTQARLAGGGRGESTVFGVVPALPVADTIKTVTTTAQGRELVTHTPPRAQLRAVQTPQGFFFGPLAALHRQYRAQGGEEAAAFSDDAALIEAAGGSVEVVAGAAQALKITRPEDLQIAATLGLTSANTKNQEK